MNEGVDVPAPREGAARGGRQRCPLGRTREGSPAPRAPRGKLPQGGGAEGAGKSGGSRARPRPGRSGCAALSGCPSSPAGGRHWLRAGRCSGQGGRSPAAGWVTARPERGGRDRRDHSSPVPPPFHLYRHRRPLHGRGAAAGGWGAPVGAGRKSCQELKPWLSTVSGAGVGRGLFPKCAWQWGRDPPRPFPSLLSWRGRGESPGLAWGGPPGAKTFRWEWGQRRMWRGGVVILVCSEHLCPHHRDPMSRVLAAAKLLQAAPRSPHGEEQQRPPVFWHLPFPVALCIAPQGKQAEPSKLHRSWTESLQLFVAPGFLLLMLWEAFSTP